MLSSLMFRSIMNPSKLEWAMLPLNARSGVRRGQMVLLISVPGTAPCGCIRQRQPEAVLDRNRPPRCL